MGQIVGQFRGQFRGQFLRLVMLASCICLLDLFSCIAQPMGLTCLVFYVILNFKVNVQAFEIIH